MANPTTPTPGSKTVPLDRSRADTGKDLGAQDAAADARYDDIDDDGGDDGGADRVEIGDPVPEKDRTVRAAGEAELLDAEEFPVDEDDSSVDPDPDPSTQRH